MKSSILVLSLALAAGSLFGQARPKVFGVGHVALRVSDVEQFRAFYKDFLGFGEPYQLNNQDGSPKPKKSL